MGAEVCGNNPSERETGMSDYATYEIHNANTGEVIALDLTLTDVDAWWELREDEYFALRVTKNVIEVVEK